MSSFVLFVVGYCIFAVYAFRYSHLDLRSIRRSFPNVCHERCTTHRDWHTHATIAACSCCPKETTTSHKAVYGHFRSNDFQNVYFISANQWYHVSDIRSEPFAKVSATHTTNWFKRISILCEHCIDTSSG